MRILVLGDDDEVARTVTRLLERSDAVRHVERIDARAVVLVDGDALSGAAAIAALRETIVIKAMRHEEPSVRFRHQDASGNGPRSKGDRKGRPRWPRPK